MKKVINAIANNAQIVGFVLMVGGSLVKIGCNIIGAVVKKD